MKHRKVIAASIPLVAIVAIGLWWRGELLPDSARKSRPLQEERYSTRSLAEDGVRDGDRRVRPAAWSDLQSLLLDQAPGRTPKLLRVLEEMQGNEFDHDLQKACQAIFDQGDLVECNAVFSLLEQREEHGSVRFLASLVEHTDEEIRHRAWMACEALAGQTMATQDEIGAWAASWTPNADIQELMKPRADAEVANEEMRHPSIRERGSDASPNGRAKLGRKAADGKDQ